MNRRLELGTVGVEAIAAIAHYARSQRGATAEVRQLAGALLGICGALEESDSWSREDAAAAGGRIAGALRRVRAVVEELEGLPQGARGRHPIGGA